jgi:ankyrin repeat protein
VNELIDRGIDINAPNQHNNTPLSIAISNKSEEVVKILLQKGVPVNDRNNRPSNESYLGLACFIGDASIVQLLLDYKARFASKAERADTKAMVRENGYRRIQHMIQESRAD